MNALFSIINPLSKQLYSLFLFWGFESQLQISSSNISTKKLVIFFFNNKTTFLIILKEVNIVLDSTIKGILDSKLTENIYKDTAQPTTSAIGEFIGRPFELLNSLFVKTDILVEQRKLVKKEILKRTEQYLSNIPDNQLVESKLYIAEPIVNQLITIIDEETISDMFIRMLAKSMNAKECDYVHPAYIKILEQMSPLDARLLKHIFSEHGIIPVIQYYFAEEHKTSFLGLTTGFTGEKIIENAIAYVEKIDYPIIQFSLRNLIRLGMVAVSEGSLIDAEKYTDINLCFEDKVNGITSDYIKQDKYVNFGVYKKNEAIEITPMGKGLCDLCLK